MLNYFEIFGLPIKYKIDERELTRKYLSKQREAHPDNNGDRETSGVLNLAYTVLKNPIGRAEHLLKLLEKDTETLPSRLSSQMFDMREKFSNISDEMEKRVFIKKISDRVNNLLKEMEALDEQDPKFLINFLESKFINSFLDKTKTNGSGRY